MENITIQKQIEINAPVAEVWEALTDTNLVKQYLFGANVDSDWKKGSPITYWGTYQGKDYKDKGVILDFQRNTLLRHTHWSSLSGKADIPENYFIVTYQLLPRTNNATIVTVSQEGNMSTQSAEHSGKNWELVLGKLKDVVERELSHSHHGG